jgi:hypothetical protein
VFAVAVPALLRRALAESMHDRGLAGPAEEEIVLSSGELLLLDNLATAHGRRGRRDTGELHQLCIGFGSLDLTGQAALLDRILAGFDHRQGHTGCALG